MIPIRETKVTLCYIYLPTLPACLVSVVRPPFYLYIYRYRYGTQGDTSKSFPFGIPPRLGRRSSLDSRVMTCRCSGWLAVPPRIAAGPCLLLRWLLAAWSRENPSARPASLSAVGADGDRLLCFSPLWLLSVACASSQTHRASHLHHILASSASSHRLRHLPSPALHVILMSQGPRLGFTNGQEDALFLASRCTFTYSHSDETSRTKVSVLQVELSSFCLNSGYRGISFRATKGCQSYAGCSYYWRVIPGTRVWQKCIIELIVSIQPRKLVSRLEICIIWLND